MITLGQIARLIVPHAILLSLAHASPQPVPADLTRPYFRTFTEKDGLPMSAVLTIAVDRSGYLWVGTQDGAAYCDGRAWTIVNMPQHRTSNLVEKILPTSDGSVWFATGLGGLARLKEGQWQTWNTANGLPSNSVLSLLETTSPGGESVLWVGTRNGMARLEKGRWQTYDVTAGLPSPIVRCLASTRAPSGDTIIWAGTPEGLAALKNGRWTVYDASSGLPSDIIWSLCASGESPEILWVGTEKGLARLTGEKITTYAGSSELPVSKVNSIVRAASPGRAEPAIWVGANNGLFRLDDAGVKRYDSTSGLPQDTVITLLYAAQPRGLSTLWIGTASAGLTRLIEGGWRVLDRSSGLPNDVVASVRATRAPDGAPGLLVGTRGGLARYARGGWTVFDQGHGLPDNVVWSILETPESNGSRDLWVGTEHGLARLANGSWRVYDTSSGLPSPIVLCLESTEEAGGASVVWAGTTSGVARFEKGEWRVYKKADGLPDENIFCFLKARSPAGSPTIWAGTAAGLAYFDNGRWRSIDPAGRLSNRWVLTLLDVTTPGGRPTLWIGTNGGGAVRLNLDPALTPSLSLTDESSPALPDNVVCRIAKDDLGRIYLFTNKGLMRLSPRTPTPQDSSEYTARLFETEDGLPSNEFNQGASCVDGEGRIWAGTVAGVAMLETATEREDLGLKPLVIERVSIGGRERRLPLAGPLSHSENRLSFEFALLSYYHQSETRFRTQLVGLDTEPSSWSVDVKREYTTLPSGSYTFTLWGRDYAGNVSGPVEVPFSIRPAPWLTWWAYLTYGIVLLGSSYAAVRVRTRALQHRAELLEAKVAERTTEINEKVDLLRASERRALESESKARDAYEELRKAQEQIARLSEASPSKLEDLSGWSRAISEEIAHAVGAREIGVWSVDGDSIRALSSGRTRPPTLEALHTQPEANLLSTEGGAVTVPVRGMTGDLRGALVIEGAGSAWGTVERQLISSFAQHLGSALDLHYLRSQLSTSEARRAATRREMNERGIHTLAVCPFCRLCYDERSRVCAVDGRALDSSRLLPATIDGRYRLVSLRGEGGMGTVFQAHDERLGREVAIKIIKPESLNDPETRFRIEREARVIAQIHHPGVVDLHDSGELEDGSAFLVMELLEGQDLSTVLERQGRGTPRQVARLVRQIGAALDAAHLAGVIHRDIKPANIFLVPVGGDFHAKVLDFGLAKSLQLDTALTATGIVIGTPAYMPPEQVQGRSVDARSDLYSLAMVAYEALVGRRALPGEDIGRILINVLSYDPPVVSSLCPEMPRLVDEAFREAMEKDPLRRPASVGAWVDSFVDVLEEVPPTTGGWVIGAQPPSPPLDPHQTLSGPEPESG